MTQLTFSKMKPSAALIQVKAPRAGPREHSRMIPGDMS